MKAAEKCLVTLLMLCLVSGTHAQEQKKVLMDDPSAQWYQKHQKKYTIAIQPMQLFNWSLRVDFELRLGDGPGWLQIGPAVYYSPNGSSSPNYYYDEGEYHYSTDGECFQIDIREPYFHMEGGGLDINYKRFVNPSRTFYLAGGLSYTHFKVEYWTRKWNDYTEDGLVYHEYGLDGIHEQQIDRIGINTYFGFQMPFRRAFLLDIFSGIAYRYSFYKNDAPMFNEYMLSYGRRGLVFLTGVRIGIGFR